jgi:hypothetical protein
MRLRKSLARRSELRYLMGRNEVSDENKNTHDDVLSDRDDIRARHFEDLDFLIDRCIEINMVGTNASGNAKLEVFGLYFGRS